jgi:hypothetical protein
VVEHDLGHALSPPRRSRPARRGTGPW